MRQADIFLDGEGDAWFTRNRAKLGERDPVSEMIASCEIKPKRVLEIGCADGWRLSRLREKYGCEIFGIEPSLMACVEAAARKVPVVHSSASVLAVQGPFDLVIYGFCLYLTDPAEWLRIAAEGDAQLCDGGHLIVHDFEPPTTGPFARRYEHCEGVLSYHFDFARLWLSNPQYTQRHSLYGSSEVVKLLRKSSKLIPVLS